MNRLRAMITVIAAGLLLFSTTVKAGHGHGGFLEDGIELLGLMLFLFGWQVGASSIVFFVVWLANPLWMIGIVSLWMHRYRVSTMVSALGAVLCLIPLGILADQGIQEIRIESPMALVFSGGKLELRLGYFAWVASQWILFIGAIICFVLFPDGLGLDGGQAVQEDGIVGERLGPPGDAPEGVEKKSRKAT